VGRLAPNTELRVLDGELLLRGPQTMTGYLNRPDATAEILDAGGWLHTGDLGHVDAHGQHVRRRPPQGADQGERRAGRAGRARGAAGHPSRVADCAVVGRPDERRGEVPVAVVVPRGDVEADAIVAWVADRVAPHKRLHDVRFADAVPRTPSGKILRRLLRDQPSYV
jgi:acyl-CoA synthetase (AMP-forming)/AMP-acid ligase II